MISSGKLLYPPFRWSDNKTGLVEDRNHERWSPDFRRQMRHGTFDWSRLTRDNDRPTDAPGA